MKKDEAKRLLKTLCRALEGLDGTFIKRILEDVPHIIERDNVWRVCYNGLDFRVYFTAGFDSRVVDNAGSYTDVNGFHRDVKVKISGWPATTKTFGGMKYRYSLEELSYMFANEPFYINHLTKENLSDYADDVSLEMREWDEWLKNGNVSEDKHSSHLAIQEEKIFTEYAPYESDINSLEEIVALFDKNLLRFDLAKFVWNKMKGKPCWLSDLTARINFASEENPIGLTTDEGLGWFIKINYYEPGKTEGNVYVVTYANSRDVMEIPKRLDQFPLEEQKKIFELIKSKA